MNKIVSSYILYILLISTSLFILFGCREVPATLASTAIPIHLSTATAPALHYTSVSRSDIFLEFNYSSSWSGSEDLQDSQIFIILREPRFSTLPTPFPSDDHNHPPLNNFGFISIRIFPITPDQSFEQFVQKSTNNSNYFIIPLSNYEDEINGQNVLVFEYKIDKNNPEIYLSEMFVRDTFFTANNLIYKIGFTIAEVDRGNEFEQGYQYFINSLRITP